MKKFIKNVCLFLSPIILLICFIIPFYVVMEKSGELDDINTCIKWQRNNSDCLIGLGYNEQTAYYKLLNTNYNKPEVIALGTSRVMQFRSDYFTTTFYNCGGAVGGNYDEYLNFLKNLDYTPKCIILGLDAWVFNHEWNYNCRVYDELVPVTEISRPKMTLVKAVINDWLDNKWTFSDVDMYPQNIGFNGCIKDQGFMMDGSYYNGYIYRNPQASSDYMFEDTYKRIETGTARFEWGSNVDSQTLTKLDALLAYCAEKGIYVIGFSPPFAPSVISKMSDSGNYLYLPEIAIKCAPLFKKYGFEFYDYLDISGVGASDDNFLDGFHGSCIAYACIVKDMVNNKSQIVQFVDSQKLNSLIQHAYNGLSFYNPDDKR